MSHFTRSRGSGTPALGGCPLMRKARSTRPSLRLVARSASHSPCCRSVRSASFCLASSAWLRVSGVRAQTSASATSIRISARSIFSKLERTRSALSCHSAMRYSLSSLAATSLSERLPFLDALSLSATLPPSEKPLTEMPSVSEATRFSGSMAFSEPLPFSDARLSH